MLSLTLNHYRFTLKLIPSILVLSLLVFFIVLGFWQIDRAQQKRDLLKTYASQAHAKPALLTATTKIDHDMQYSTLKVVGYYDNQHQFLLDNKFDHHRLGFEVITPVRVTNSNTLLLSDKILLVNRGWIARGKTRKDLPTIATPKDKLTLHGIVYFPKNNTFVLNDKQDNPDNWPRILQKLDLSAISKILAKPVYPFILRLNKNQQGSFSTNWRPVIMKPQKHLGYAVQWFGLAIAALVLLVIVNLEWSLERPGEKHPS